MPKTSYVQKIILVIFGIFLSFVLLEIGLRTVGFIYAFLQDSRNILSLKSNGTYSILCLGESTTAFGGYNSYPSQLEDILNKNDRGLTFSIINKGVPGTNTTAILRNLQDNLKKYKPDIVITMMGINDNEVDLLYEKLHNEPAFLKKLRTYKLVNHILSGFKAMRGVTNDEDQEGLEVKKIHGFYLTYESKKRQQSLEQLKNIIPESIFKDLRSAWLDFDKNDFENSRMILEDTIKKHPNNYYAYSNLAEYYCTRNEYGKAINFFPKISELKPAGQDLSSFLIDCYLDLDWRRMEPRDIAIAEKLLNEAAENQPNNSDLIGLLANLYWLEGKHDISNRYFLDVNELRRHHFNPTTKDNYLALHKIVSSQNIQLVVVQYPMSDITPLRNIFYNKNDVIFVDNEDSFKEAVKDRNYNDYFIDMFAGTFGHCTPQGNRLLADNIADVILRKIFP